VNPSAIAKIILGRKLPSMAHFELKYITDKFSQAKLYDYLPFNKSQHRAVEQRPFFSGWNIKKDFEKTSSTPSLPLSYAVKFPTPMYLLTMSLNQQFFAFFTHFVKLSMVSVIYFHKFAAYSYETPHIY